jgi:hypothetical protein
LTGADSFDKGLVVGGVLVGGAAVSIGFLVFLLLAGLF